MWWQRRLCFLFLSVSADAHLRLVTHSQYSMISRTIKRLTVTFNPTQQGDTNSFPADASWSVASSYSSQCSYATHMWRFFPFLQFFNFSLVLSRLNISAGKLWTWMFWPKPKLHKQLKNKNRATNSYHTSTLQGESARGHEKTILGSA